MTRQCGSCTLCCRLLPVNEGWTAVNAATGERRRIETFTKPAMTRCEHQCSQGCRIYRERPQSCVAWSCTWLKGAELPRPDRAHYVVDMMMDVIRVRNDESGEVFMQPAVQVWIEPGHEEVHRDPRLRTYLDKMAREHGAVAIIRRYNERTREGTGLTIIPPSLPSNKEGMWLEIESAMDLNISDLEKMEELAEQGVIPIL